MSYKSKWLVSIGMVAGCFLFFGYMVIEIKTSGIAIPMTFAGIVFFALGASLKSVWEKTKNERNNKTILQG